MNNVFNNDVKLLISNLNFELDKTNKEITKRKRKIDFKNFFYYLIKYNINPKSSYSNTNVELFNYQESCDVSYQAYLKKRNNLDISLFEIINDKFINSLYKHITDDNKINNFKYKIGNNHYRLISCDGSQLNFLYSLNDKFKSNKHNTYTYSTLSCLYDTELKIPINYVLSNDDERKILIEQFKYLNNNDILIADRGYYSFELAKKLNENNINFVLRMSTHNKFYTNNIKIIDKSDEGSIEIVNKFSDDKNQKMKLYWYRTYQDDNKDYNDLLLSIDKINDELNLHKNNLKEYSIKYDNLHKENKKFLIKVKNKPNYQQLNNKINNNRKQKNKLNTLINETKIKINSLKEKSKDLYNDKREKDLMKKSKYYIVTNLLDSNITQIKEIYKKRWEVETHFKYAKELTKLDLIENKNYKYIKQNLLINQLIFLISGYVQYILNKKVDAKKKIKISDLMMSLKSRLIYYFLKNDMKHLDLIITLLDKLITCVINKIITIVFKDRIKKRPEKNHYNSNVKK